MGSMGFPVLVSFYTTGTWAMLAVGGGGRPIQLSHAVPLRSNPSSISTIHPSSHCFSPDLALGIRKSMAAPRSYVEDFEELYNQVSSGFDDGPGHPSGNPAAPNYTQQKQPTYDNKGYGYEDPSEIYR